MRRRYWIGIAAALATAAGVTGLFIGRGAAPAQPSRPLSVAAVKVTVRDVSVYVSAPGTVVPWQSVLVRTRVDGQITRIRFLEGQHVQAGDVLVEIDARPFKARLTEAIGQLKRDQALLHSNEIDLARYRAAAGTGTVTQQMVDNQAGLVEQNKATVIADKGAVEDATVNLSYCVIRAPMAGVIGIRQVDEGNVVHAADQNGIAMIATVEPIAVTFPIPQKDIARVQSARHKSGNVSAEVLDAARAHTLSRGRLEAMDNTVDPATGTVRIKARFPNHDNALFPGSFVFARLRVNTYRHVPVVPAQAVLHGGAGAYVFTVAPDNTARLIHVKTGPEEHGEVALVDGDIKEGDIVITDGAGRASDKLPVNAHTASPSASERRPAVGGTASPDESQ